MLKEVTCEVILLLKQEMMELNAKNSMLEARLQEGNKLLQFYKTKDKSLLHGRLFFIHLKDALMSFVSKTKHEMGRLTFVPPAGDGTSPQDPTTTPPVWMCLLKYCDRMRL